MLETEEQQQYLSTGLAQEDVQHGGAHVLSLVNHHHIIVCQSGPIQLPHLQLPILPNKDTWATHCTPSATWQKYTHQSLQLIKGSNIFYPQLHNWILMYVGRLSEDQIKSIPLFINKKRLLLLLSSVQLKRGEEGKGREGKVAQHHLTWVILICCCLEHLVISAQTASASARITWGRTENEIKKERQTK